MVIGRCKYGELIVAIVAPIVGGAHFVNRAHAAPPHDSTALIRRTEEAGEPLDPHSIDDTSVGSPNVEVPVPHESPPVDEWIPAPPRGTRESTPLNPPLVRGQGQRA